MGQLHLLQKNKAFDTDDEYEDSRGMKSVYINFAMVCADKCTTPAAKIILQWSGSAKSHAFERSRSPWECCINSCKLICDTLQVTYSSLSDHFYKRHNLASALETLEKGRD